jgi:uncharacterized repeat protein (TIGR01451 family)
MFAVVLLGGVSVTSLPARGIHRAPAEPVIAVAQQAGLQIDRNDNDLADPGDTLRYTVTISNVGSTDALDANFAETLDPNTLLVADSLKVSPLALDGGYVVTQSQPMREDAPGLLANDFAVPAAQVVAYSGPRRTNWATTARW